MGKKLIYKIVLCGEGAVGKTSLLYQFVHNEFKENYLTTVGAEFLKKEIIFKKYTANLVIWDMAGQDRFAGVRKNFYGGANGALLIFDLTNPESFTHLRKWIKEIEENAGVIPFILIGNKVDLLDGDKRFIDEEEIKKFVEEKDSLYVETSAKSGDNVENAFKEITKLMAQSKGIIIK
jgi:small GTP-binding protein